MSETAKVGKTMRENMKRALLAAAEAITSPLRQTGLSDKARALSALMEQAGLCDTYRKFVANLSALLTGESEYEQAGAIGRQPAPNVFTAVKVGEDVGNYKAGHVYLVHVRRNRRGSGVALLTRNGLRGKSVTPDEYTIASAEEVAECVDKLTNDQLRAILDNDQWASALSEVVPESDGAFDEVTSE